MPDVSKLDDAVLAVYSRDQDVLLIDLRPDGRNALRESAAALADGYIHCGYFTVANGQPRVECADGLRAAYAMMCAGRTFAELLITRAARGEAN